jgi:peptide-methionine (S)-S-oxide reductase
VGYCGGTKEKPTYRAMDDHTEAISIDFDPSVTSYRKLLEQFWAGINPKSRNWGTQYRKAVFYRNEQQREEAEKSRAQLASEKGLAVAAIKTDLVPVQAFTYAEGYHQNYFLRRNSEERLFLEEIYPTAKAFADSAVATRLNAYVGSGLEQDWEGFAEELAGYGLPDALTKRLEKLAAKRGG